MLGAQAKGLLKVSDRFVGVPFAGGQKTDVVPGVGQSIGIARVELHGAFEGLPRLCGLLLLQVDASQAVQGLGAGGVVAKSSLERSLGLIEVTALKIDGTQG